jgi:hypothetical protein
VPFINREGKPSRADHLHFGIYVSDDITGAINGWGYGEPRDFRDPESFLQQHKPVK